jgi:hypothetical protein
VISTISFQQGAPPFFNPPRTPDSVITHIPALIVCGISVRQDADGRYCINDLHRASGGEAKHKPGNWLMLDQTKALAAEIEIAGNPAISEKAGIPAIHATTGRNGGTYVVKELVYAYGMWISPAFHLKVIRAYDALVTQSSPTQSQYPKSRKALPGGLTLEQQDAVKALVRSRVEVLPKAKQGKAAITCWSSIKSKFGVKTYKEVPPEQFGEVLSLVARLPLEGEHIPAGQPEPALPQSAPVREGRVLLTFSQGAPVSVRILEDDEALISRDDILTLKRQLMDDNLRCVVRIQEFCNRTA